MRIVAGKFRGKQLDTPKSDDIRPTSDRVREAVFSIIGSRIGPNLDGLYVLDLFAGTGAMGLEAISRGAAHCVFVDTGIEARGLIRGHIESFGLGGQTKLLKRDAADLGPIERLRPADLVFCDPPYGKNLGEKAIASALAGGWVAAEALILIEEDKDVAIEAPVGTQIVDRRDYGGTAITFLERTG
ncbi:16S rRNA (guanine(966)-N(2))-methyltransferase RsmD [Pelagibacterium sp. 26DY04]|uniref:16S rRNA (guanine(966)-N(2))-methyltransferase RsmD n=1 Tax=Pelagibacterium sp. 26DY04 TaxID=2967130 RepID=UPI002814B0F1|nr:16S rRNA (guanine(966)-N(2))-methyltransferase RsmD [Pelagibacterium sp. 26DY04]WMT87817.1 16S rRNA (guanine(966)-N(2))-methyltransferase RsmD [Pelagibacterium sp. 26DY04]